MQISHKLHRCCKLIKFQAELMTPQETWPCAGAPISITSTSLLSEEWDTLVKLLLILTWFKGHLLHEASLSPPDRPGLSASIVAPTLSAYFSFQTL